jgi:hypothetical protein
MFNPDEPILRPLRGDSRKCHPRSLGLNLRSLYFAQGFDDQELFASSLKSVTLALEHLVVETLNGPIGLFWLTYWPSGPFLPCEGHDMTFGSISPCLLYIVPRGNPNFTPHSLTMPTFALTTSPSLLCTCLELRELLALAMEGEGSPVVDIVGDASKGHLPEASTASSSSDASSSGATSDVAETEAEISVDPRKLVRSYEFGASSITVGRIRQMESLGYFAKGSAREPGEEIVPKPNSDEAVVFEEFFAAGLRMPPHRAFTKIQLKFWVQLHQLTLNAIAQMLKYFWTVLSSGGEPSSDGFAKHYELHYQTKKVPIDGFDKYQQFGVINFHGKRGSEAGLVPAMKNKWPAGWTKVWFYCKVPLHSCPRGGKTVQALRSHMSALNFCTKPITCSRL